MSTTTLPTRNAAVIRILGLVSIIAGVVLIVAGVATWTMVRSQLVDEQITVSEDAAHFGGTIVDGPLAAYYQADAIKHHSLEAGGGKTYAQLDREDPARATVMNGAFLRSSLFTSVISFGVAAFAAGMGLMFLVIGYALRLLAPKQAVVTADPVAAAV